MRELRGKTAVINGGASGIGRAMAEAFAAESTRVVLADIELGALDEAAGALRAAGASVLYVLTHAECASRVQERMEDILEGRNPAAALSRG